MSFLKRIELQGFKSFAEKTVIELPERVVAVVGPNGSGKSNVVDALRWVLGEREASRLRGDTLDKLIFAGSAKTRAVGLARVSLYFDNRDRVFPIDAEEVELERRIDRSGTSEFFWNSETILLRDLIPILARAKLGSRGLTMIGQGESDIFVRSSPEERRQMVEEILGLKEFRLKKHGAERRLALSVINLDKVKAMIEELAPHLRLLRRQRTRFEKRSEIEKKLKLYEDDYFSFQFHGLSGLMGKAEEPIAGYRAAKSKKEEDVKAIEKHLKEINEKSSEPEKIKKLRSDLNDLLNKKFSLKESLGRLEAEIEIRKSVPREHASLYEFETGVRNLIKKIEELLEFDDVSEIKKQLKESVAKLKELLKEEEKDNRDSLGKKKELEEALLTIDKEIKNLEEESERLTYVQEELNQEFRREVERLEVEKNELRKLEQSIQSALFEKEKIEIRVTELRREWRAAGREAAELENLPPVGNDIDSSDLDRKIVRMRGELAAIGEIDEGLVEEAKEKEERYEFLRKEVSDLEAAIADLKNLIKELEDKIHSEFKTSFKEINEEFNKYFRLMFGGGRAKLKLQVYKPLVLEENAVGAEEGAAPAGGPLRSREGEASEPFASLDASRSGLPEETSGRELKAGIEIDLNVPQKSLKGIEMLSGGEKSLVSMAALFALISVSPPPFLVLDEIDAALDEENARRFSELIKEFSKRTQFILVTHNRATMEAAHALYGVTMGEDGISKILSLKLE
ncbi:MAG: AAA family ATPase [Candidatus Jorgensenbacteria bacterium]